MSLCTCSLIHDPWHYGRLLLHLERSKARGCLIFHFLLSYPTFSRFWAGSWARWVVKVVELFLFFFSNCGMDNLEIFMQPAAWNFKLFCLEFNFLDWSF